MEIKLRKVKLLFLGKYFANMLFLGKYFHNSSDVHVASGVPQGTVLGPLLFLCHINDLPESVSSQVRLFADDCLLYRPIKTHKDHITLQNDLNNLELEAQVSLYRSPDINKSS